MDLSRNESDQDVKKETKQAGTNKDQNQTIPQTDSLAQFFDRMPFLERIGPALAEMGRMLCADEDGHEAGGELPEYYHHIVAVFRRTYFKHFPSLADLAGGGTGEGPDWRRLGKLIGIGLRCLRFGRHELEQAGLSPEQGKEFLQMFLGGQLPGPDEAVNRADTICEAVPEWNRLAFQWGPEAMAELNAGVAEGIEGFLNEAGELAGESNRANIYWFLLLAWPEIKEMQQAAKTRRDFAAWLEPFARAGVITAMDLDQLYHLCGDIGLKFKGAGAPRKRK